MKSKDPLRQVNNLLNNYFVSPFESLKMFPIYVICNYFDLKELLGCICGETIDIALAGCSYADAIDVYSKIVRKKNSLLELYDIQFA